MNYIKYIVISFLLICSCNKKTVEEESSPEIIIEVGFPELASDGSYELNKVYNGVGNHTTYYP